MLPSNSSISVALSPALAKTVTVITYAESSEDEITINSVSTDSPRLRRIIDLFKRVSKNPAPLKIESVNTFPTGAGLASSASGAVALVAALNAFYDCGLPDAALSGIARLGSGSAARGFAAVARWHARAPSTPPLPRELLDAGVGRSFATGLRVHPAVRALRVFLVIVDARRKGVASTDGMRRTRETSALFAARARVAEARCDELEGHIRAGDTAALLELTMRDSNTFHALCHDAFPPIRYMAARSWDVVALVHEFNSARGATVAAYTFDAGPNAVLLCEREHAAALAAELARGGFAFSEGGIADTPVCVRREEDAE